MKKLFSTFEAARKLGVKRSTLYVWKKSGRLVPVKITKQSRRWSYSLEQLDNFYDKKDIEANGLQKIDYQECKLSKALIDAIFPRIMFNILKNFTKRERMVLTKRFVNNEELEEVGKSLSVTRERVRQIETSALKKLRTRLKLSI